MNEILVLLVTALTILLVRKFDNLAKYILIAYVFSIYMMRNYNLAEYMTDTEAVANVAALYNTGNFTVTNLTVTGKIKGGTDNTVKIDGNVDATGNGTFGAAFVGSGVDQNWAKFAHKNMGGSDKSVGIFNSNDGKFLTLRSDDTLDFYAGDGNKPASSNRGLAILKDGIATQNVNATGDGTFGVARIGTHDMFGPAARFAHKDSTDNNGFYAYDNNKPIFDEVNMMLVGKHARAMLDKGMDWIDRKQTHTQFGIGPTGLWMP